MPGKKEKLIAVENINHPGQIKYLSADMHHAMKRAFLKILPDRTPGLTLDEIQERILAELPDRLYPDGAKAGWWAKTVQLDLEAKAIICREKSKPLRLHKAAR
jgi:hypothetical protein